MNNTTPDHTPQQPADPNAPVLRPHVFDGIEEYDQKLPNWWLFTFYFAIAWFVIYWFLYYNLGQFQTDHERVTSQITAIQQTKARELEAMLAKLDDKVLWEWSRNTQITDQGAATYQKFCVVCHATDLSATLAGAKLPGLPLNDAEWKYGAKPMDLFKLVQKGTPDKTQAIQMPPWEQTLSPGDIAKVVAFVLSHHKEPATTEAPKVSAN
jgi:cytochrome c oxidase cbb3-type subunit 3